MATTSASRVDTIVNDPLWHAHRINADFTQIQFVRLDRDAHRSITFLEEQYFPEDIERVVLPFAVVAAAASELLNPTPRFIFHSSMATSTLMARVFDLPGTSMSLAEPIILNELSALSSRKTDVMPALPTVLRLLGRPFEPGEVIVIKPGNSANNLMPTIANILPDMRAVCIHAPLRDFIRSIAKKGMVARIVYRRLYAFVGRSVSLPTGFRPEDVFEQTDLQIAAMAWLMQHAQFVESLGMFPDRFRSIDSSQFLNEKAVALRALSDHFAIPLNADAISKGPVFDRHSKQLGRTFSVEEREASYAKVEEAYGEEIGMVVGWLKAVAAHVALPEILPYPLIS